MRRSNPKVNHGLLRYARNDGTFIHNDGTFIHNNDTFIRNNEAHRRVDTILVREEYAVLRVPPRHCEEHIVRRSNPKVNHGLLRYARNDDTFIRNDGTFIRNDGTFIRNDGTFNDAVLYELRSIISFLGHHN